MPLLVGIAVAASLAAPPPPAPGKHVRPTKIAVSELDAEFGTDEKFAHLVTTLVTAELRKVPAFTVTSQDDIKSLIGFDRQRQMLQCAEASCLAEIGGALGVDQMVTGSIAKLGESLVLVLRAVDVHKAKVVHEVTRRLVAARQDAVLDILPGAVAELYGLPPPPGPKPAPEPAPAAALSPNVQGAYQGSTSRWDNGSGSLLATGLFLVLGGGGTIGAFEAIASPSTAGGVTRYRGIGAGSVQLFDDIGYASEGLAVAGLAMFVGGLTWGLATPAHGSASP